MFKKLRKTKSRLEQYQLSETKSSFLDVEVAQLKIKLAVMFNKDYLEVTL
jgi:hypothetical protein